MHIYIDKYYLCFIKVSAMFLFYDIYEPVTREHRRKGEGVVAKFQ